MLELFLLAVIVVVIIDLSGVTDDLKSGLKRILTKGRMSDPNYSFKPFDCSFCMTFWSGIAYLLVVRNFTLWMVAYLLLLCVLTPVIGTFIVLVRELLLKILKKLL